MKEGRKDVISRKEGRMEGFQGRKEERKDTWRKKRRNERYPP
jgi:hypothetical protein